MRQIRWAVVSVLLCAGPVAAVDITTCGEAVPNYDVGILQADLDCSLDPVVAISLGERATLFLNGHSIIAAPTATAVACNVRRCKVLGPGDISGGHVGIYADRNLEVRDVTLHDLAYGVYSGVGKMIAANVTVTNAFGGLHTAGRMDAVNVNSSGNTGSGISVIKTLRGNTITASDNGGPGVACKRFQIDGLVALNNGQIPNRQGAGLLSSRGGTLSNATLTGNQYSDPFLGAFAVDVLSHGRPRVSNTTCDHSVRRDKRDGHIVGPWGICASD